MQKIVVIGGGILGASTAYHLVKKKDDIEVILIDRKDRGQATAAAAGIVCPWISQRRNKAWYTLAKNGARYYPTLIKQLLEDGETNTGYKQVGAISLHTDDSKLDAMEERVSIKRKEAPEIGTITRLDARNTKALFPPLNEQYSSVHISGAARVDGRELCKALIRAAIKNGATFIEGDARLLVEKDEVIGVTVEKEQIRADEVIVCTGAWAKEILQPLNVDFKVSFQRAQIIHVALENENTNSWPVVMPPSDQYVLAFDNHRIVCGTTHENIEEFDCRQTLAGLQEVFMKALQTAPGLANSTFLEARVGFRPYTPGFLPVIGRLPGWERMIIANGLGSSGLTAGPYVGAEIAKLALGLDTELDLTQYDVAGAL